MMLLIVLLIIIASFYFLFRGTSKQLRRLIYDPFWIVITLLAVATTIVMIVQYMAYPSSVFGGGQDCNNLDKSLPYFYIFSLVVAVWFTYTIYAVAKGRQFELAAQGLTSMRWIRFGSGIALMLLILFSLFVAMYFCIEF